jgi:hypothetical protein
MIERHDIEYALENTKTLRRAPGIVLEGTNLALDFCVVAEDLDEIDLTHVIEGALAVRFHNRRLLKDEEVRAFLENFESAEAWHYAEGLPRLMEIKRSIVLSKERTRHNTLHTRIEDVVSNVLSIPGTGLVLQAPVTGWEISLLSQAAADLTLRLRNLNP